MDGRLRAGLSACAAAAGTSATRAPCSRYTSTETCPRLSEVASRRWRSARSLECRGVHRAAPLRGADLLLVPLGAFRAVAR
eukprot:scaffold1189_cov315-Prasinococcus_capsulatus_cf.AAC.3